MAFRLFSFAAPDDADIRAELKEDTACLPAIRRLQRSADPMIVKHASIALEAVLWEP